MPALSETRKAVAHDGTLTRLVSLRRAGWKLIEAPAFPEFLTMPAYDMITSDVA